MREHGKSCLKLSTTGSILSKTNLEHIRESDRQIKEGKVVVKTMEELCDK